MHDSYDAEIALVSLKDSQHDFSGLDGVLFANDGFVVVETKDGTWVPFDLDRKGLRVEVITHFKVPYLFYTQAQKIRFGQQGLNEAGRVVTKTIGTLRNMGELALK